jgi:hypothetical protein
LGVRHEDRQWIAAIDAGVPDATGPYPPVGQLPETHIFVQPNIFFLVNKSSGCFNALITHLEHHGQSNP